MNRKTILAISGLLLFIGMDASSMASDALAYYRPVLDSTGKLSGPIFTMPTISPDGDLSKSLLLDSYGNIAKFTRPGWEDYYLKMVGMNVNSVVYNLINAKTNQKVIVPEEVMPIFANNGNPLTFKSDGSIEGGVGTSPGYSLVQTNITYNNYKVIKSDDKNMDIRYYIERKDSNGVIIRFDSYGKIIGVQSGKLMNKFFSPIAESDQLNDAAVLSNSDGNFNDVDGASYQNKDGLNITVHGTFVTISKPDNYYFKTIAVEPSNAVYEKDYSMKNGMPIPAVTQPSIPDVTPPSLSSTVGNVEAKILYFTQESNIPETRFFIDPNSTTKLDTELCKTNGFSVFDDTIFLILSDSFYSGLGFSATYSIPESNSFLPCVLQSIRINKAT